MRWGHFVDGTRETGILQGESGVQSCNACSNDSDVVYSSSAFEARKNWMHSRYKAALYFSLRVFSRWERSMAIKATLSQALWMPTNNSSSVAAAMKNSAGAG